MFLFFSVPEIWKTGLTCLIGLATLIGIMTRPFRWNEAVIAMAGAAVLLLLGLITPVDACLTLMRDWNTFLFFLGMMALSALAEVAGLFDWLAVQAARLAGQSAARLFLNVFLLGTLISMVLSNDATALILTPIVYVLVTKLRLPVLPYLLPAPSSPIPRLSCCRSVTQLILLLLRGSRSICGHFCVSFFCQAWLRDRKSVV